MYIYVHRNLPLLRAIPLDQTGEPDVSSKTIMVAQQHLEIGNDVPRSIGGLPFLRN